jgi:hypothetical protein
MAYRDELAFRTRRDELRREVEKLSERRDELVEKETSLRETLRKARLRLAGAKVVRWLKRHPVLAFFVLLIVTIVVAVRVQTMREEREKGRRIASLLGEGCDSKLSVKAQPGGTVHINGLRFGATPIERTICKRGRYLVRVIHDEAIPWQQVVTFSGQAKLAVRADLIPRRNRPADAMVIHSVPDNAVVFVNGVEIGLAPVMFRTSQFPARQKQQKGQKGKAGRLRVGLWTPNHKGRSLSIRTARDAWIHLAKLSGGK